MSETDSIKPADYRLREMEHARDMVAYRVAIARITEWRLRMELEYYRREIRRLKLEEV